MAGRQDHPSPFGKGRAEGAGVWGPQAPKKKAQGGLGGISDGAGKGGAGQPYSPNDRKRATFLRRPNPPLQPNLPQAEGAGRALLPPPPSPHPLRPLPYPHAQPTSQCRPKSPPWRLPPQGVGAGPALPCFPLSISRHFSPRPSASVRLAPWQIRLVPLCRLFRRPPAEPSDRHPVRAWQRRLVSLCRLVRRASIPSCAASPQAGPAGKKRAAQFKASQIAACPGVSGPPRSLALP